MTPVIVQLPFPSQADPHPLIQQYYRTYAEYFKKFILGFSFREGDLWEAPLWVGHLDGAIGRNETRFADLSQMPVDAAACVESLISTTGGQFSIFLFSPLAQNLTLSAAISKELMTRGNLTVLGGNMTELADVGSFSFVYSGHAYHGFLDEVLSKRGPSFIQKLGRQHAAFGYRPNYRFLSRFSDRVPLVRINASHGCLYGCTFCGDAWSHQLHIIRKDDLISEFEDISEHFSNARLIYVGDKTFGQSREAVRNLISARPPNRYKFIVQTHVKTVSAQLLDQMQELGVVVVEMGLETADSTLLRGMKKPNDNFRYLQLIKEIRDRGMHVVFNLLGGLPRATKASHSATLSFIREAGEDVSLYNLYNFVPYPKTALFQELRSRIVDWDFLHWREDCPVVFRPYSETIGELWDQFLELVSVCDTFVRKRIDGSSPELVST